VSGYFDTSALCRLYHREPGSDVVDRLLNEPGSQHLVSWLTMLETQSALAQKVRTGDITARKFQMLGKRLKADIARRRLLAVRMLRRYFDEAGELIAKYGSKQRLRAADALHLAIAIDLWRGRDIHCFVTADAMLVMFARQEGLTVVNPLDP
jgi:predicted nucleic acid-binding protein